MRGRCAVRPDRAAACESSAASGLSLVINPSASAGAFFRISFQPLGMAAFGNGCRRRSRMNRIPWPRLALLWLAGVDLRITLLAVPPLLPWIHRDLPLDETAVA